MAIGSTLQIPEKLLEQMKKVDSELDIMTKKAEKAGSAFDNAFRNVASGSLTGVINLLQTLNKELANTASVAGSLGGSMRQAGSESTTALSNTTRQAKETTRGITDLASAVERYTDFLNLAAKGGASLGSVKTTIKEITSLLNSPTQAGNGDTQALMEAQQRLTTIRAQLKAMSNVMNANVSPTAALQYAESAASVNERTQAIKLLTAARNSLRTTDEGYTQTLNTLNAKIKEMNAANKQVIAGSKEVATTHRNLMDISGQLARKLALVFSVSQLTGYFRMLINVRGEFELAQRSLESMLGNMSKADAIFQKTVDLAVHSPFTVRQLVSYTKQLSAYRIETDKLYDTTKRLADVSAGLGVDMQRIILAYGQVKAAAYLRGTEVRQFTEAGVNLYDELRRLYKDTKGVNYTTGDIVSLISRRGVTFSDVEAVFQRMTDEGGMFYNMQEIQAETLKGKVSNLHDSVDIMLNDIGQKNDSVLKGLIEGITAIIRNWEKFSGVLVAGLTTLVTYKTTMLIIKKIIPGIVAMWKAMRAGGISPIAGITSAAIGIGAAAISYLVQKTNEYNEAIAKTNEEYLKQEKILTKLEASFTVANTLADKQNAISDFIETAANTNFILPKEWTEGLTEENVDERMAKIKEMYEDFAKSLQDIRVKFADSGAWYNFGDDIDEDMKQYAASIAQAETHYNQMVAYIGTVLREEKNLTAEQKNQLELLKAGSKEGESRYQYLERASDAINKMWIASPGLKRLDTKGVVWQTTNAISNVHSDAKEAASEFYDAFNETFTALVADTTYSDEEKTILAKNLIDAMSLEWSEASHQLAYNLANERYGFNIQIDQKAIEEQLGSLDIYLNEWFENHEYTVRVQGGKVATNDFVDTMAKMSSALQNGYKNYKDAYDMLQRGTNTQYTQEKLHDLGISDAAIEELLGYAPSLTGAEVFETSTLMDALKEKIDGIKESAKAHGVELEKETKKTKRSNDVWSQRISLLKKAAARYEKLRKLMSDGNAQAKTLAAFTPALVSSGLPLDIIEGFSPTKEGLKNTLTSLTGIINDAKRELDVKGEIAELEIKIDEEKLAEELETAKKKIESAFSGLELFQELLDAGLSEWQIKGMLPDLASSFSDVEGAIEEQLGGKEGTEAEEEYKEQKVKLSEKVNKQAIDDMKEIVKNYGEQLSEQLQLDIWYQKEKAKIEKTSYLDQDLRDTALKNLKIQYNEKTAENTWKQFQMSDFYLRIFDDVEMMSTRMLNAMRTKLQGLKEEMKDLDPSQLEDVTKAMNEIEDELDSRNPFSAFASSIGGFVSGIGKRNSLEKNYLDLLKKEEELQGAQKNASAKVNAAGTAYTYSIATHGVSSPQTKQAVENLSNAEKELNGVNKELEETQDASEKTANKLQNMDDNTNKTVKSLSEMAEVLQEIQNAMSDFGETFTALGYETPEMVENLSSAFNYGSQAFEAGSQAVAAYASGNYIGAITSGVSALSSAVSSIGSIFGFGNHDAKLQEKIEALQREIDSLDHTIEKLQETFDDAWSAVNLINTKDETIEAMEQQIEDYEAMIKAEKDKKDTDEDQIQEWEEAIEDLEDDIEDLEEDFIEALGGFGSEANYKSAAEDFSDAWVEAFRESEDTLEALEDTFDDYFYNLISKQITNRAAEEYIRPILEAFDAAVAEDSDEGVYVTDEELAELQALKEENLEAYDEYLRALMEVLGVEADASTDSSLSQLQQGIESISEETGAALESLLNSIRFYVAQQTTDVIAIRNLLEAQYGSTTSSSSSSTLVLAELQSQTALIKNISSILSSVTMSGWKNGGKGIKVFMD